MARTKDTLATLALVLVALFVPREAATAALGEVVIPVLGAQVDIDTRPDLEGIQSSMAAVKDIPTGVRTFLGVPGVASSPRPQPGTLVKAELSGPSLGDASVTVMAPPNQLLELPVFRAPGDHFLRNVRLEDATGAVILIRDPTKPPIVIDVLSQLLVTQVTSRPLTLEEIAEKGIVIDDDNFTVLNFTVGLTLGSEQVVIDLPVVIPTTNLALAQVGTPSFPRIEPNRQRLGGISIPNFSIVGFGLAIPPDDEQKLKNLIPPINGVIVIPGNIAFLNQFFSVILQVANTGPEGSGLVVENASARIALPPGDDEILDTGDDPLRVAETQAGGIAVELPLVDGEGVATILPQATNMAEFLVEGLREGTHDVTFDVRGDLFVPALGETVELTGRAAGVVQVKNPTYSVVLAHPDIVRAGEEYSLFTTVTNTSSTPANLFRLELPARQLSGVRLASGEESVRELTTLLPGDAETFEFRLTALTTGKVTGTVFLADEGINGSFVLTTGVGDTGIPLSPDTLVLPQTVDYLPGDPGIVFAAVRLLGQAYSVATAPGGALPPEIARVGRPYVFDRAVKLAQSGLHVRFGETPSAAVQDLLLDYLGNDLDRLDVLFPDDAAARQDERDDAAAFDGLRRAAAAGENFSSVVAEQLANELDAASLADFQRDQATRFASRPGYVSFGASSLGSPVLLELRDDVGNRLGHLASEDPVAREVPFGARLRFPPSDRNNEILMIGSPQTVAIDFHFALPAGQAEVDLSLVVPASGAVAGPDGEGAVVVVWPSLSLAAGGSGSLQWRRGVDNTFSIDLDTDGDGAIDLSLAPSSIVPIEDRPPALVGVHQWAKGDRPETRPSFALGEPLGRMLGVLFDEEVSVETAERLDAYAVDENAANSLSLQPDRRLVFLILERPVGPFVSRDLLVREVEDLRGNRMGAEELPIQPDPDRGVAGRFTGQVVTAAGRPVPFAPVSYIQPLFRESLSECFPKDFVISTYEADGDGRFGIDFVLQNGHQRVCTADIWQNETAATGTNNFKLEAEDPDTGELGRTSTRVQFDGQHLDFRIVIRGTGSIEGFVFDEEGNLFPGGDPGTAESIPVFARNLSTGESYLSWVDGDGYYAFPRSFEEPDGGVVSAPSLATGNIAIQIVRGVDGFTGVTTVNLPAEGAVVERDIVMFPPFRFGTVTGRLLEADRVTPAANISVQIAADTLASVALGSRATARRVVASAFTDANGEFRFEDIPAGDIELRALRTETFELAGAVSFLPENGEVNVVLVLPGGGGTVRGIVRDSFGNPVPGATVAGGPTLTTADENGRFEILGLPLGMFTIFGQGSESLSVGEVKITTTGPGDLQEIVISLEPIGSIVGTVFEADGTTPVLAQKVQLWRGPDDGVAAETFTDPNGEFRFENFPVDTYSVRAIDPFRFDGGMTITDIRFAGDVRDADIVYRGLGAIEGRVIQSNGTPVFSDVLITHKVWKIIVDTPPIDNQALALAILDQFAQVDGLGGSVQRSIEENQLNAGPSEFFVLVDETAITSSNTLGPGGEVTGRFTFDDNVAAGPFTVAAFGPFLSPAEVRGAIPNTTIAAERNVDVGDIVLEPSTGSVRGTVYLPDGETPVGADVSVTIQSLGNSGTVLTSVGGQTQPVLPEITVRTEEDGSFLFPLVLRGAFVLTADTGAPLVASATGPADMETEVVADLNVRLFGQAKGSAPAGDEPVGIDIRLEDVSGIVVRVVESDGTTPVEGARVRVTTQSNLDTDPVAAFTDANGEVDFFPLIEGMFSVSVSLVADPRRGGATGEVPVNPGNGLELPVNVQLGAVTTVSGQVIESAIFGGVGGQIFKSDGTPLVNPAQVTVSARGVQILAVTDGDGRYLAENVPGGFFQVDVFEPFTARRGSAQGTLTTEGQLADIDVTLTGLGRVVGEVFDSDGSEMLSGVDLMLLPSGNFSEKLISRTDPDGFFSLPGVPLGPYTVMATDPDNGLMGEASDVMENDGDVNTTDVYLEPTGRITGIVYAAGVDVDEAGPSSPVAAGAAVTFGRSGFEQTVQTDASGNFASSEFLRLGDYSVVVNGGNDGARTTAVLSFDGDEAVLEIALQGLGAVEGVVLDSVGVDPVAGASVTLASESEFRRGAVSRITDAEGRFDFSDVPVGVFAISVQTNLQVPQLGGAADGVVEFHDELVLFEDDRAIVLQAAARVIGMVVLDDGATPAEAAIVRIAGEGRQLTRLTGSAGSFRFDGTPLGDYTLFVVHPSSNGVATVNAQLAINGEEFDVGTLVLDSAAPIVVSTDPVAGAAGVNPALPIDVNFSEPIDLDSLGGDGLVGDDAFTVFAAGEPVAGSFSSGATASIVRFTPTLPLPDLTPISVELRADVIGFEGQLIEAGVRDPAGNSIVSDFSFGFTTGDSLPPTLVSLSPQDGAFEVELSNVLRVEFDEPIDPDSIQSFTLLDSGAPVSGTLNMLPILGGRVVVLTPDLPLFPNRHYQATLAGPVRDRVGNASGDAEIAWSFATIDTLAPVIESLNLAPGSVIREGSVVTLTAQPAPGVVDVASVDFYVDGELVETRSSAPFTYSVELLPALGGATTVGAIARDFSGNRSSLVELPIAISNNEPPVVTITSPAAGNVSQGATVTVVVAASDDIGVASVAFSAGGGIAGSGSQAFPASASAQASFNFDVPTDTPAGTNIVIETAATDTLGLTSVPATVTLVVEDLLPPSIAIGSPVDGAEVDPGDVVSVFVRGDDTSGIAQLSLSASGATAFAQTRDFAGSPSPASGNFEVPIPGTAAGGDEIVLMATARDAAGLEAQQAITLRVRDAELPLVTVVSATGSNEVDPGGTARVRVAASDAGGVIALELQVDGGDTQTLSLSPRENVAQVFSFDVPADLGVGSEIIARAFATDRSGNRGAAPPLILTTVDRTPPSVSITSHSTGDAVVAGTDLVVTVEASDALDVTSISCTASGAVEAEQTIQIDPSASSATRNCSFAVPGDATAGAAISIRATALDAAGNQAIAARVNLTVADTTAPELDSIDPSDGTSDVAPDLVIRVEFDEAIERDSFEAGFRLVGPEGDVLGNIAASAGDSVFRFTPTDALMNTASYDVIVDASVRDLAGNTLAAPTTSSFTVTADVEAPCIVEFAPIDGASALSLRPEIEVRFDEPIEMNSVTADTAAIVRVTADGEPFPAVAAQIVFSDSDATVTLVPMTRLDLATEYRVRWSTDITDPAGNRLRTLAECLGGPAEPSATIALEHGFSTGSIELSSSSVDGRVIEGQTIGIDAIASPALGVAALEYTANDLPIGDVLPPNLALDFVVPGLVELGTNVLRIGALVQVDGEVTDVAVPELSLDVLSATDDADTDGLSNGDELTSGTDPFNPDTDGDGLLDGEDPAPLDATPTVTLVDPQDGDVDVSLVTAVRIDFSTPLDPATVNAVSVQLAPDAGAALLADVAVSANGRRVTVTPEQVLEPATPYVLTLTTQIQSAAGVALAEAFTSGFATGGFTLVFPRDGETVSENTETVLEVRAAIGIGISNVIFSVNGHDVASVASAPGSTSYVASFVTPFAADTPQLVVVARAIGAFGTEIARDEVTVNVAAAFRFVPQIVGIPLGEPVSAALVRTTPAAADQELTLQALGAGIVGLPVDPVVFPAGETRIEIPLVGDALGSTTVIATSGASQAALIISVHTPQSGRAARVEAIPAGLTLRPVRSVAVLVRPPGSFFSPLSIPPSIPVLDAPASENLPLLVTSTDPAVAQALLAFIPEGQRNLELLDLTTGVPGTATLTLAAEGIRFAVEVRVDDGLPPALSVPAGVTVRPVNHIARVIALPGVTQRVTVPILNAPASGETPVVVVSSNTAVADVTSAVSIADGERAASFDVVSGVAGTVTLTLSADGTLASVEVVVGGPVAPTLAVPVGVSTRPAPPIARVFAQAGGFQSISPRLLADIAAEDVEFSISSSDPTVAVASGPVTVPAGERSASVDIVAGTEGVAVLKLRAAGIELAIEVIVGGPVVPTLAVPAGVSVRPAPPIARLLILAGGFQSIAPRLLSAVAAEDVVFSVFSSDPAVADASGPVTVSAGERSASVDVVAGIEGVAVLKLRAAGIELDIEVIVGAPAQPGSAPVLAVPAGVEVEEDP